MTHEQVDNSEKSGPASQETKQIEKVSEFTERLAIEGRDIRRGFVKGAPFILGPIKKSRSTNPAPQSSA